MLTNKIHDAFDSVKADPQLIEATKQFLSEKRRQNRRLIRQPAFRKALAAVCVAVILAVGFGGYSWIQAPVSYVSIDVNPSIELALNLTDESELVFTVAAASSRESELKTGIEECSSHLGHNSQSVSAEIEDVSHAHENGLSLGKYYAYLQLLQYDVSVTIDECRDMSISEIHCRINDHEQEEHGQEGKHGLEEECGQEEEHGQEGEHEQEEDHKQEEEHRQVGKHEQEGEQHK